MTNLHPFSAARRRDCDSLGREPQEPSPFPWPDSTAGFSAAMRRHCISLGREPQEPPSDPRPSSANARASPAAQSHTFAIAKVWDWAAGEFAIGVIERHPGPGAHAPGYGNAAAIRGLGIQRCCNAGPGAHAPGYGNAAAIRGLGTQRCCNAGPGAHAPGYGNAAPVRGLGLCRPLGPETPWSEPA